jgi:hypothetical protein
LRPVSCSWRKIAISPTTRTHATLAGRQLCNANDTFERKSNLQDARLRNGRSRFFDALALRDERKVAAFLQWPRLQLHVVVVRMGCSVGRRAVAYEKVGFAPALPSGYRFLNSSRRCADKIVGHHPLGHSHERALCWLNGCGSNGSPAILEGFALVIGEKSHFTHSSWFRAKTALQIPLHIARRGFDSSGMPFFNGSVPKLHKQYPQHFSGL